ncbi:hypothetical protein OIO90_002043 [Microbotryomycetes sp. JL221]|nr:hypothetical protein OIO90_002043 [Microbotryomycetes sp. JL221]
MGDDDSAQREQALNKGQQLVDELRQSEAKQLSTELESAIVQAHAQQIVDNIKARKQGWTATNVIVVYISRAIKLHRQFNILTEIMFEEAIHRAQQLDKEFNKTGKIVGQLHGVPVSLKDQIDVKGHDSTIGMSSLVDKPAQQNSTIAQILLDQGAILFTKTAVPQTMLSFECSSPVFGISLNPHSQKPYEDGEVKFRHVGEDLKLQRVPGGSSGGEAALLASDGSVMGIGSDIGGSLRIPAHFSGCFGLKPCRGRFPVSGCVNPNGGFEAIISTMGPMGRTVSDLELATRVFADQSSRLSRTELTVLPIPYRQIELPKKLKFGYYLTDGFVRSSPACERAVLETVEALRKQGHECIEFTPPDAVLGLEIFVAVTSADGYKTLLSGAGRDPIEASMWLTTTGPSLPGPFRAMSSWAADNLLKDPIFAKVLRAAKVKTAGELQQWNAIKHKFVSDFRKYVWGELGLDAIICAPQAVPALRPNETWDLSALAFGTFLYNVVDSTAGVVPVTFVDPSKDAVTDEWRSKQTIVGSTVVEKKVYGVKGTAGGAYNADEMKGLPVGVQIVGGPWEEEKVIELMKVVDNALGPRGFGPAMFGSQGASSSSSPFGGPSPLFGQHNNNQSTSSSFAQQSHSQQQQSPHSFNQSSSSSSATAGGSLFGNNNNGQYRFAGSPAAAATTGGGVFGSSSTPSYGNQQQQHGYFGQQQSTSSSFGGNAQYGTPGSTAGPLGTPGNNAAQQTTKRTYLPGYLSGGTMAQAEISSPQAMTDDARTTWDSPAARKTSISNSPRYGNQSLFGSMVSKDGATPSRSPKMQLFGRGATSTSAMYSRAAADMDEDAPPISSLGEMDGGGYDAAIYHHDAMNQSTLAKTSNGGNSLPSQQSSAAGYAINVFGFPSSALELVLEYFGQFGEIQSTMPSTEGGNWVTIVYTQAWSAFRAARKNGEVLGGALMIGVKAVDEDQLRRAVEGNNGGSTTTSSGDAKLEVATAGTNPHVNTHSHNNSSGGRMPSATPSGKQSNVFGPDSAFKPTPPRRGFFGTPSTNTKQTTQVAGIGASDSSQVAHASLFAEKSKQAVMQQQGQQQRGVLGKVSDAIFGW